MFVLLVVFYRILDLLLCPLEHELLVIVSCCDQLHVYA